MTLPIEVAQWWTMLPEVDRQKIVGKIPGALAYGLTKTVLPKAAEDEVVKVYESEQRRALAFFDHREARGYTSER